MLTQESLGQFTGTEAYHSLGLTTKMTKVIMSDGALHVAKEAGAFWLMDEIAFAVAQVAKQNDRLAGIQFWHLQKSGTIARLLCYEDTGMKPAYVKHIEFTDFPLDSIDLWVQPTQLGDEDYWLIHLPSEY